MNRRDFLKAGAGLMAGAAFLVKVPWVARAAVLAEAEKSIGILNLHTGERVKATFWAEGALVEEEMIRISRVMRDHRTGEVIAIDPGLIERLHRLQELVESDRILELISGYRSARTNAALQANTEGVAENSFHVKGQAADVRIAGVDLLRLHRAARTMKAGGVGYYPFSDFLHMDSGPVRFW